MLWVVVVERQRQRAVGEGLSSGFQVYLAIVVTYTAGLRFVDWSHSVRFGSVLVSIRLCHTAVDGSIPCVRRSRLLRLTLVAFAEGGGGEDINRSITTSLANCTAFTNLPCRLLITCSLSFSPFFGALVLCLSCFCSVLSFVLASCRNTDRIGETKRFFARLERFLWRWQEGKEGIPLSVVGSLALVSGGREKGRFRPHAPARVRLRSCMC